mgnify:CR=1 FL=1
MEKYTKYIVKFYTTELNNQVDKILKKYNLPTDQQKLKQLGYKIVIEETDILQNRITKIQLYKVVDQSQFKLTYGFRID